MTKIVAHRGASYLAGRDNTLESFRLAIELGADMVEFDVRSTRDNVLVVFHDSTFADSPISWLTFDKLEKEAEERGFHIPTFEEVLELCHGKIRMDIEIKEEGFESKLVKICHKYLDYSEYTIKSFFEKIVYRVKKLDKNITTGLLLGMRTMNPMRRLSEIFPYGRVLRCRCDFVSPNEWLVRLGFVERMHFHKIPVYVWTVNRKRTMKRYLKMGVDGLITDKPDAALFVRKELGAKRYEKKNKRIHRIYR
jgi:glycerophosphoryl diester phosphodiesterase